MLGFIKINLGYFLIGLLKKNQNSQSQNIGCFKISRYQYIAKISPKYRDILGSDILGRYFDPI